MICYSSNVMNEMIYAIIFVLCVNCSCADEVSVKNLNEKIVNLELQLQKLQDTMKSSTTSQSIEDLPLVQARKLYNKARFYLSQQKLEWSYNIFNQIIEKYDSNYYVALSMFWKAEKLLNQKQYLESSLIYSNAYKIIIKLKLEKNLHIDNFQEDRDKIPEMLAKIAFCLIKLGKIKEASKTISFLKKEHSVIPKQLQDFIDQIS